MAKLHRLLLAAFIESIATIFLERGFYFFTEDRLSFTRAQNSSIALAFGLMYVLGALLSHRACLRFGEKRILIGTIAAMAAFHFGMAMPTPTWLLCTLFAAVGLVNGMKWPVMESYVSAGRGPREQSRAIGLFSIAWSTAVPISLLITGPMIAAQQWALEGGLPVQLNLMFAAAAIANLGAMFVLRRIPAKPIHLEGDHPERMPPNQLAAMRGLKLSFQWSLFGSYTLLFFIAPILPEMLKGLGHSVKWSSGLSAIMDLMRVASFAVLFSMTWWHGRRDLAIYSLVLLPISFFIMLLAPNTPTIIVGQIIFGLTAGLVYFAALYYGMVTQNAAVDAGGAHESLIGLGFAIGPMAGLIGLGIGGRFEGVTDSAGLSIAAAPIIVLSVIMAARTLRLRSTVELSPADLPD